MVEGRNLEVEIDGKNTFVDGIEDRVLMPFCDGRGQAAPFHATLQIPKIQFRQPCNLHALALKYFFFGLQTI
jgi:hypothetical protein